MLMHAMPTRPRKSIFTVPGVILLVATLTGCGQQTEAEELAEATAAVAARCRSDGARALPNLGAAEIEQYCRCASSRLVTDLGIEGVRRLNAQDQMSDEDQQLMRQASATCVADLLQGLQQDAR